VSIRSHGRCAVERVVLTGRRAFSQKREARTHQWVPKTPPRPQHAVLAPTPLVATPPAALADNPTGPPGHGEREPCPEGNDRHKNGLDRALTKNQQSRKVVKVRKMWRDARQFRGPHDGGRAGWPRSLRVRFAGLQRTRPAHPPCSVPRGRPILVDPGPLLFRPERLLACLSGAFLATPASLTCPPTGRAPGRRP